MAMEMASRRAAIGGTAGDEPPPYEEGSTERSPALVA